MCVWVAMRWRRSVDFTSSIFMLPTRLQNEQRRPLRIRRIRRRSCRNVNAAAMEDVEMAEEGAIPPSEQHDQEAVQHPILSEEAIGSFNFLNAPAWMQVCRVIVMSDALMWWRRSRSRR
jgi:hypothetical protein